MNPTRIRAPVMASKHFMRMVTAMALFNVGSPRKVEISHPILVIDRFIEKSYMFF